MNRTTELFFATIFVTSLALSSGCSVTVNSCNSVNGKCCSTCMCPPPTLDGKTLILFNGHDFTAWHDREGKPSTWQVQKDGSVLARDGDAITNEQFGDFQLHIEFFCPITEGKEGQAKSNSGVYLQGRYEIQVLDSYGAAPANNLCGGIYQIAAPLVNASRPAGEWQCYDVVFRAARFDNQNKMTEPARVSVAQNCEAIHNNLILPQATPGGLDQTVTATGPILLQFHGDPVRFRNIWIRKL